MMRAAELQGLRVRTERGERLGRVDEIHLRDGQVTALVCGPAGLLQRFTTSRRGRRVNWDDVREISLTEVVVAGASSDR